LADQRPICYSKPDIQRDEPGPSASGKSRPSRCSHMTGIG
jgi:hypothetical protein